LTETSYCAGKTALLLWMCLLRRQVATGTVQKAWIVRTIKECQRKEGSAANYKSEMLMSMFCSAGKVAAQTVQEAAVVELRRRLEREGRQAGQPKECRANVYVFAAQARLRLGRCRRR